MSYCPINNMEEKQTKQEKFKQEIEALRIITSKITADKTYVLLQKKAVKNWRNVWVVYSGRPYEGETIKDFMLSKGQIAY